MEHSNPQIIAFFILITKDCPSLPLHLIFCVLTHRNEFTLYSMSCDTGQHKAKSLLHSRGKIIASCLQIINNPSVQPSASLISILTGTYLQGNVLIGSQRKYSLIMAGLEKVFICIKCFQMFNESLVHLYMFFTFHWFIREQWQHRLNFCGGSVEIASSYFHSKLPFEV